MFQKIIIYLQGLLAHKNIETINDKVFVNQQPVQSLQRITLDMTNKA